MDRSGITETTLFVIMPGIAAVIPFAAAGACVFALLWLLGLWQAGAVLGASAAAYGVVSMKKSGVAVTDKSVKIGGEVLPFENITAVDCEQGLYGKLFGCGSLVVSAEGRCFVCRFLPRADDLSSRIGKQIDLYFFRKTCREAELAKKDME